MNNYYKEVNLDCMSDSDVQSFFCLNMKTYNILLLIHMPKYSCLFFIRRNFYLSYFLSDKKEVYNKKWIKDSIYY